MTPHQFWKCTPKKFNALCKVHVRMNSIEGAKNSKTVALAMASFLSNHFFSEGITILANNSLNNFLIDFLKTNLNKKRKTLYLTDIKCEEEDIDG